MVSTLNPAKMCGWPSDLQEKAYKLCSSSLSQKLDTHLSMIGWEGVVTCSVSEATDGRPSKPSVDKERAGVSSQTIVMTFHWRVIRGRHRRDKVRRRN